MNELQKWEMIENEQAELGIGPGLTVVSHEDIPADGDDSIHEEDA